MQLALKLSKYAFRIASTIPLIAFTNEITDEDVEHAPVGSRKISEKAEQSMLAQAFQSHSEIRQNLKQSYQNKNEFDGLESIKEYWFGRNRSIPQHWIKGINYQTNVIITEEGAHWKIASGQYNASILNYWLVNDSVTIQPNYHDSNYPYEIKNQISGQRLSVELIVGPELYSAHTLWINGYNMGAKKVYLSNDSCWMVADADMGIFRDWQPNDQIIIGSSNSWFSSYDAILINPQMNNFVRAKSY
jgi:hypothetical protein